MKFWFEAILEPYGLHWEWFMGIWIIIFVVLLCFWVWYWVKYLKIGWYKGIGLSCDNFILRKRIYFKLWIQITKYWGIAIIRYSKDSNSEKQFTD